MQLILFVGKMLEMLDASFKLFNLRFWCKLKKKGLARVIGLHLAAQIARQGRADGKQEQGGRGEPE